MVKRSSSVRFTDEYHRRFSTVTNLETEGGKRVKRVRFADPETNHLPNSKFDASSTEHEAAKAPRTDAPKTSEYAFFKKIKENACNSSHLLHKEDKRLKNVESNDRRRDVPEAYKKSGKHVKSSFPVENARQVTSHSFLSPPGDVPKKSELNNMFAPSCQNIMSPLLGEVKAGKNDWIPPFGNRSDVSGNKGIFSAKREKLRLWVANTSFPEIDELCSKGFDLVSMLLSRLFPKDDENKQCGDPVLGQVVMDAKYDLASSSDSDTIVNELHQPQIRNLMESEHSSYLDDSFFRWSNRYRDVDLLEWDSVGSDSSLINHTAKAHTQDKYSRNLYDMDDQRFPSLCSADVSSFHESFERYAPGNLNEMENLHVHSGHELRGWAHPLLLSWDVNSEQDKEELSVLPSDRELDLSSTLPISWGNDYQQCINDRLMCSSPSFQNTSSNFAILPHHINSFDTHDFGRYHEEGNYLGELTLSCTPKHLKLVEECMFDKGSIIKLPTKDHTSFMDEVLDEKHHRCLKSFLLPAQLKTIPRWKFLSAADSLYHHDLSYYGPLRFPQIEGLHSFLLDEGDEENSHYSSKGLGYL